jgi:hypothetical protein
MPMVSVTFPAREVMGSIAAPCKCRTCAQNNRNEEKQKIENGVLHGFLQNCAMPKKVCKKTSGNQCRTELC